MKLNEALNEGLPRKLSSAAKALMPKYKGQAKIGMSDPQKSADGFRALIKRNIKDRQANKELMDAVDEYQSAMEQDDLRKSAYWNAFLNDTIKNYEGR